MLDRLKEGGGSSERRSRVLRGGSPTWDKSAYEALTGGRFDQLAEPAFGSGCRVFVDQVLAGGSVQSLGGEAKF